MFDTLHAYKTKVILFNINNRPQNLNWQDWKHTDYANIICYSQNI